MYDTNITSKITDSKTREVDYGRDIADLAGVVTQLQHEVVKLSMLVSQLRKQLEDQGTLYGGAVAYSTTFTSEGEWYRKLDNLGEAI